MEPFVLCPDCKRKLKVPETAVGKTIRCPACKALIPPVSEPSPAVSNPENSEPDNPSPLLSVTAASSLRTTPAPSQDEELEDEAEPAAEKPIRKKASGREEPIRKKSSVGLIIGLVVGGVLLLLTLLGTAAGLLLYFVLNKTIPEAEWQAFSPPNSDCTVFMPGTPAPQTSNMLGLQMTQYQIEREKENAFFGVAFFDLPPHLLRPNVLEDITNGSRRGALARMNGSKVTSETSISLGRLPGREFQIKPPTRGTFITRVYLAKVGNTHRVYLVMAAGDFIQPNKGDAARFFNSFQVTGPATPPVLGGGPVAQGPQPPVINPPGGNRPRPHPVSPQQKPPRRPRLGRAPLPGERTVWDESTGTRAFALAFAPDSAALAVGHLDKKLRVWDVAGGVDRQLIPSKDLGCIRAVAFSADGGTLASGGDDGKVILWDPATGKERSRFQVLHARPQDKYYATALRFSPDDKSLIVAIRPWGNSNAEVHLWDLENNKEGAIFRDCKEEVKKLAFISDGAIVILMDHSVRVWDAANNQVRREFKAKKPAEEFITSALSPDGQTLATLGDDKKIRMWRLSDGECLQTWSVKADVIRQSYFPLEFSPEGKLLALGGRGPNLYLWDAQTGKERKTIRVGQSSGFVGLLTFSPDGRLLALHGTSGPKILEVAKLLPGD